MNWRALRRNWRMFARAIINNAIKNEDWEFFLDEDSVFDLVAEIADLDAAMVRNFAINRARHSMRIGV